MQIPAPIRTKSTAPHRLGDVVRIPNGRAGQDYGVDGAGGGVTGVDGAGEVCCGAVDGDVCCGVLDVGGGLVWVLDPPPLGVVVWSVELLEESLPLDDDPPVESFWFWSEPDELFDEPPPPK
jgi:hypothetical protein